MPADFLQLEGRRIAVFGVANRKSVAYHIAKQLEEAGAEVVYVVRSPERHESVSKLTGSAQVHVCDVEFQEQIDELTKSLKEKYGVLHGFVHSIAFADYDERGMIPFHETSRKQLLRTFDISCYSLIALSNALKEMLTRDASVVTISISTTRMASENYGFMAPVKAALDSSLAFLAKSFSKFSEVRFNAVAPGLLKTSASAGIPGYVDSYLYAERATLRGRAIKTEEAAAAATFLLSPRSSGITAQQIVVDAGMEVNYFDDRLIRPAVDSLGE
ncbi:enoyl-ACP reductase FabI [Adhaeretor mobilis]|uniref:Enoyl-[acyl-carrier-protein] reductase [NADH] n=1 Tax=Adhaeretor mobilis TaxID=1930276 RepID=A0A517MUH6_9BACT|nr:SDR family oxidoreductase [Adhaeretor mobilis]QDS98526.1 Enoyl-[acyl-carrier-protein] reductase [NADH] FabI [Adhaeretor mobilis]